MHSSTSYLVKAILEWITDSGYTPLLLVEVMDDENLVVPLEFVKDGQIVFNVSNNAAVDLMLGELISFKARFHGVSQDVFVPWTAVVALFARENQEGIYFTEEGVKLLFKPEDEPQNIKNNQLSTVKPKSKLTVVTQSSESSQSSKPPTKSHLTLLK